MSSHSILGAITGFVIVLFLIVMWAIGSEDAK